MGVHQEFDQRVIGWVNGLKAQSQSRTGVPPQEFVALDHLLHDMRLFKSRPEVDTMRQSARIAVGAHKRAMRFGVRPHRIRGDGGAAARVPPQQRRHLVSPDRRRRRECHPPLPRELGDAQRRRPAADRRGLRVRAVRLRHHAHLPGQRSLHARAARIYEVVLDAQYAAIAKTRPGNHWNEPHDAAVRAITQGW